MLKLSEQEKQEIVRFIETGSKIVEVSVGKNGGRK